MEGSKTLLCS